MIRMLEPLSAGNAVRLMLSLSPWAEYQRILCKQVDNFSGPADSFALTVADDCGSDFLVDARDSLVNGVEVFYRAFEFDGSTWHDQGVSFPAIPASSYTPDKLDVQEFVRDRMQLGITGAIAAGRLFPQSGGIQVTTAPFSLAESTTFPTISVHLESTGSADRGIGDEFEDFYAQLETKWVGTEGWLSRTALNIVGVSQNADERIQIRKTIRQIIQANLPVFSGASMTLIEFSQTDSEQFSENNVPLYMTNGAFSCLAPAWIRETEGTISEVTLDPAVQTSGMQTIDDIGVEDVW